jgi:hypothetical protein
MSAKRALVTIALAALLFAQCCDRALAAASVTVSVVSGSPVSFAPTDIINAAFPATGTLTATMTVTTTSGGGGGSIALTAPASVTGSGGSIFNPVLISFSCARGTAGTWFVPAGTQTIVPGGTSAACATITANQTSQTGTFVITYTINDRYDSAAPLDADTWNATSGFSIVATAN